MFLSRASGTLALGTLTILAGAGCSGSGTGSTGPSLSVETGGSGSTSGGSAPYSSLSTGGALATGGSNGQIQAGASGQVGGASTVSTGGSSAQAGGNATGGKGTTGGVSSSVGGTSSAGGKTSTGGVPATGGSSANGGKGTTGGAATSGGTKSTGGSATAGGASATGGSKPTGGTSSAGGASSSGSCTITISSSGVSSKMNTVGYVEWSTTSTVSSAQVVYTLNNAGSSILNKGGTAPVDLTKTNYHTLLLGLKQSSTYAAHVEAILSDGSTCKSSDFTVTTTTLAGAPTITRTATNAAAQANGFIITSSGLTGTAAYIIDADGAVVWYYGSAPSSCSRARMDYEGVNMWAMALNVQNTGGQMNYISMDGQTSKSSVAGLTTAHHDFTALKNGIIATMAWSKTGTDVESDLIELTASSTSVPAAKFHIGSNLYVGGQSALGAGSDTYHANSILYHSADDTYTIGDRNPNLFVKVTHAGSAVWQFGGTCSGAPAPKCASGSWSVNHGHHLLDTGEFLLFNNGTFGSSSTPSHALDYTLSTSGTMGATLVHDYKSSGNEHSDSLGDVQRLPNGNTLVTFSNNGLIQELDASWNIVQTLKNSSFGFADWRATLYGPPPR